MTENIKIKRALLSVSDKSGLAELGQKLAAMDVALISTGGTAKALRDAGLEVADISDVTNFPEMMDGGATSLAFRKNMAAKAFAATARYDGMIAQWFGFADQGKMFPDTLPLTMSRPVELRYGENPHQSAALYLPDGPSASGIAQAEQLQGRRPWLSSSTPIRAASPAPTILSMRIKRRSPATAFLLSAASSRSTARSTAPRRKP